MGILQPPFSAQQCGPSSHCEMDCEVNNEVRVPCLCSGSQLPTPPDSLVSTVTPSPPLSLSILTPLP